MKQSIKRFFAQFGTTVVLVGLCAYLVLQLALGIGETVDVEHTTYVTVQDTIQLEGYIFREETPLYSGRDGTNSYLTDDGERVSVGTPVAITYSDTAAASVQDQITQLNRKIRILEQSNLSAGALTTDLSILDGRIQSLTVELLRQVADGDLDKALRGEESLWVQMNRRQALLSADGASYSTRINLLEQEKADLERSLTGQSTTVHASGPGYYYYVTDGYEQIFTPEAVEHLTLQRFEELTRSVPDERILQKACGKMVSSSEWYVAVSTDKLTAGSYREGTVYPVLFPYSGGVSLNMKLHKRIAQTDLDTVVLVFSANAMPDGFDFTRCQTIQLVVGTYRGIRVSADALRVLDGVLGCYVLDGTRVVFKKTEILYQNEEFAVCEVPYDPVRKSRENKAYESDDCLSLHDTVITSGDDLYVGKILQ